MEWNWLANVLRTKTFMDGSTSLRRNKITRREKRERGRKNEKKKEKKKMVAGLRLLRAILLIKLVPLPPPSFILDRPFFLPRSRSLIFSMRRDVVRGVKVVVRFRLKRRDNEHKFHRCGVTYFIPLGTKTRVEPVPKFVENLRQTFPFFQPFSLSFFLSFAAIQLIYFLDRTCATLHRSIHRSGFFVISNF